MSSRVRYGLVDPAELQRTFDACRKDPSMRSVSAILRLTREQLHERGNLGVYPKLFKGACVLLAIAFPFGPLSHGETFDLWLKVMLGLGAVAAALGYGVWDARELRQERTRQEAAIRTLAADALAEILRHDFPRKPLLREQEQTLRELMRAVPRPGLELLLKSE